MSSKRCKSAHLTVGQNTTKESFTKDIEESFQEINLICKTCSEPFLKINDLKEHIQEIHIKKQLAYEAISSEKEVSEKHVIENKSEIKTYGQSDQKHAYKCESCSRTFYQKNELQKHVKSVHEKSNDSHNSNEDSHSEVSYIEKQLIVHDKIRSSCGYCGKKLSDLINLKRHILSIHMKVRYTCGSCNKQFSNQENLRRHVKAVHDKVTYTCDSCNKTFSYRNNLKKHVKAIHKKIHHTCQSCKKTFSKKQLLLNHIKNIHEKVTHACTVNTPWK